MKLKEKQEGDPWFTLRDYLFGNNLGAATLQIFMGVAAVSLVYAIYRLVFG